jgi:hypothetical protein
MNWRKAPNYGRFALWAGVAAVGLLASVPAVMAGNATIISQAPVLSGGTRSILRRLQGTCTWQSASIRTDRSKVRAEPATMIAKAAFDGEGNVLLTHARTNFDGVVVDESYSGTYTLGPDGDGAITFNFANPTSQLIYDFQLSDSHKVLRFMRELDMVPEPVGSTGAALSSQRLSIGVCKLDE